MWRESGGLQKSQTGRNGNGKDGRLRFQGSRRRLGRKKSHGLEGATRSKESIDPHLNLNRLSEWRQSLTQPIGNTGSANTQPRCKSCLHRGGHRLKPRAQLDSGPVTAQVSAGQSSCVDPLFHGVRYVDTLKYLSKTVSPNN